MKKSQEREKIDRFNLILSRIYLATGVTTQVGLAGVLEIRQSSISDAKRRGAVPAEWLLKLYRSHGLDPDWILDGVGDPYLRTDRALISSDKLLADSAAISKYARDRGVGRIVNYSSMAGADRNSSVWKQDVKGTVSVPLSYCMDKEPVVVLVEGHAMSPLISHGAYVGISKEPEQYGDGDICAVYEPYHGLMIRRVYVQHGGFRLIAENTRFDDVILPAKDMAACMVGRVLWVMQQL